jgi:hypothetical protein
MRRATATTITLLGIIAGLAGLEHGIFEIIRGDVRPESLVFASMGPPCNPEISWNACEPALTIFLSYLPAGILTIIVSLFIIIWSAVFIRSKHGGTVLMLLSVALILTGGGIFPPVIGFISGAVGTRINKPLPKKSPLKITLFAAKLWPWPLVIYMTWIFGQFLIGYFFNDFLKSIMGFGLLLTLTMLSLSIYTAFAYDIIRNASENE